MKTCLRGKKAVGFKLRHCRLRGVDLLLAAFGRYCRLFDYKG